MRKERWILYYRYIKKQEKLVIVSNYNLKQIAGQTDLF
jgi:hypothetical protein